MARERAKFDFPVNGFGGTNVTSPSEQHRVQVLRRNSPLYVLHNFFASSSVQLLYQTNTSRIALQTPANPYGLDMQIAALPNSALNWSENEVRSIRFEDLPDDAQYKYTQVSHAYLLATHHLPIPEHVGRNNIINRIKAFIQQKSSEPTGRYLTENVQYLSWIEHPGKTARTIFATHTHGPVIQRSWPRPSNWNIESVDHQTQQLINLMENTAGKSLIATIKQDMIDHAESEELKKRIANNIEFASRIHVEQSSVLNPIGYSLVFNDITSKNLLKETSYMTTITLLHDKAYGRAMKQLQLGITNPKSVYYGLLKPEDITIPQPSFSRFRELLPPDKEGQKRYRMTISPTISSNGGVFEVSGIQLLRGPDFPFPLQKKQFRRYQRKVSQETLRLTRGDHKHEIKRVNNTERLLGMSIRRRTYTEPDYD